MGFDDQFEWVAVPSTGLSGGLISLWNKQNFEVSYTKVVKNWILFRGVCKLSRSPLVCINIYAPQSTTLKATLWNNLRGCLEQLGNIPIVITGDFNSVLFKSERENCRYREVDSTNFLNFVKRSAMLNVQILNSNFTWFGPSNKRSKLDRALISHEWVRTGSWVLVSLRRRNSDHRPIVLKSSQCNWGPKPFKFFNCWLQDKGLMDNLGAIWKKSGLTNLCARFKEVREYTRSWNSQQFGNIDSRIEKLEKELEEADSNNILDSVKQLIRAKLEEFQSLKASMLCQKARVNWQLQGERNTKFFHKVIGKRKARNQILRLFVNNQWVTNPSEVKNSLFEHFRNFLGADDFVKVFNLGTVELSALEEEESRELIKEFTMQEIEDALNRTDPQKAPGPDGFNAGILKSLWNEIKADILNFFANFHSRNAIPKGCNASFIALIPKKEEAISASEFRPISLMNATMKLLTKTLALRLRG